MNILLARPADRAFWRARDHTQPASVAIASAAHRASASAPELAGIRAALDQAQARQQAARIERAPDLAGLGWLHDDVARWQRRHVHPRSANQHPFFSIAKNNAAAREAQAQEKQRQTLVSTEARIRGEVRQALLRVEAAERHIWLHSKTLLPTAERAVQAAQAGYQSGRVSLCSSMRHERWSIIGWN